MKRGLKPKGQLADQAKAYKNRIPYPDEEGTETSHTGAGQQRTADKPNPPPDERRAERKERGALSAPLRAGPETAFPTPIRRGVKLRGDPREPVVFEKKPHSLPR